MKRWVILVLGAYLLVYLVRAVPTYIEIAPRGLVFGIAMRSIGIVAGIVFWKRMTWT
jgi:hypothetical protein